MNNFSDPRSGSSLVAKNKGKSFINRVAVAFFPDIRKYRPESQDFQQSAMKNLLVNMPSYQAPGSIFLVYFFNKFYQTN